MEEMKERDNQLEDLKTFIDSSYESVNSILEALEWDRDHILTTDVSSSMVTCPISNQHRVPNERLSKHVTHCKWKNEGYSDADVPLPEVTEHNRSTIVLDQQHQLYLLKQVTPKSEDNSTLEARNVPQTAERLMSDFSSSERLALYNYAVANTMPPAFLKADELSISYKKDEGTRAKTKLELLMEMRDAKRRRISYRSKKVHTNRKTHVEILREVIQNQMDFLREISSKENEDDVGSTRSSETNVVKVENDMTEIDVPEWKRSNRDTKSETNAYDSRRDFSRVRRHESQEWYTKDKYGSRKRDPESKVHNGSYRRDAGLRYDKYEQSSTSTDMSQVLYDDHSGTQSENRREKSTNWYHKRKRERSESSDWESGDNERARKVESTYYETERSKHHKKHGHRSESHRSHESSFSRSEKRIKDGKKRMYETMSTSEFEYGETSKCDSEKQKYHDVKHKEYKLKAVSRNFHRSDSESSEFSYGKQTAQEHKTAHTYASEEEYVHDKEECISNSYYSYWKHTKEEKEGSEKKSKHHKKKKKKKKSKYEDRSSSD
ncbi:U11/U12 small nuclear ribonucleoprotein 48 kDa protein-like isoform X1 [Schistocerca gregaria]|uniref:U11/U12 small nuclear ribonucleoprotein 48 kDa protein-like isoform X1 n=2 Tax=Schistocerca gregaria TaxID=7010 RepID=UPI00211E6273|nr:U11/U12 small nuclear ribonucleoprotein 48 kDa protein-like isoform X1 [Schistocerca gregaria]